MDQSKDIILAPDEMFDKLKGFGLYQLFALLFSIISLWTNGLYLFSIPIFMITPPLLCSNSFGKWEPCSESPENICKYGIKYTYDVPTTFNFISEFDLLCNPSISAIISASIFIGQVPGFVLFGIIGDICGRILVIIIGISLYFLVLTFVMLLPSFIGIIIAGTAVIGFITTSFGSTPYAFIYESIKEDNISKIGTLMNTNYAITQLIVVSLSLGYFKWRLHVFLTICLSATLFIFLPFLKDPPKYYHSKDMTEKMIESYKKISKVNRAEWNEQWKIKKFEQDQEASKEKKSVLELFKKKKYLYRLLFFTMQLVSSAVMYYGITMGTPSVSGNTSLNAAANAGAEILAYFASGYLLEKVGYFLCFDIGFLISGVCLLVKNLFKQSIFEALLMYIAKFGISACFGLVLISIDITFPPHIRNTATSIAFSIDTLGSALISYFEGGSFKLLAFTTYFITTLLGMISSYYLHLKLLKPKSNPINLSNVN